MLQLSPKSQIFLAVKPVDFRRGIDGLAAVCRQVLGENPFSGALFLFCNRNKSAIKILAFDGQGFWICHKRLSTGRFQWWPKTDQPRFTLSPAQLQILLWNGDPLKAMIPPDWRKLEGAQTK